MRLTTGSLIVLVTAGVSSAGQLAPPAGPVASTGRFGTRIEVNEVNTPADGNAHFNITQPGSYYLAGDVVAVGPVSGIEISADDVTLDLNGYTIRPEETGIDGIRLTGAANTSVRNGVIRGFLGRGVEGLQSSGTIVEGVRATDNGGGIRVDTGSLVRGCLALGNGGHGFELITSASLLDSVADSNGRAGVKADASVISRCTITSNSEEGVVSTLIMVIDTCLISGNTLDGIKVTTNLTLSNTTMTGNGGAGVSVNKGLAMRGCNASNNTGAGVALVDFGTIEGCTTNDNNGGGMDLGSWITVRGCTAVSNDSHGFDGFQRTSFYDCQSSANAQAGFRVKFAGIVRGCVVDFNQVDGIVLDEGGGCLILNNAITNNTGHGVRVTGTSASNRIEGNHFLGMAVSISTTRDTDFVARNTAIVAPFSLGANVDYGRIFNNLGGGFLLDQPWANFEP